MKIGVPSMFLGGKKPEEHAREGRGSYSLTRPESRGLGRDPWVLKISYPSRERYLLIGVDFRKKKV